MIAFAHKSYISPDHRLQHICFEISMPLRIRKVSWKSAFVRSERTRSHNGSKETPADHIHLRRRHGGLGGEFVVSSTRLWLE